MSIRQCVFNHNSAETHGGGISTVTASPEISECSFFENFTKYASGGIHNSYSTPRILNCLFAYNQTEGNGGAIGNCESSALIVNCTFYANQALTDYEPGNALYAYDDTPSTIANCILWNGDNQYNPLISSSTIVTASYSCIQGGFEGEGNIDQDPLLIAPRDGDYRLLPDSPCIDVAGAETAPSIDILGVARPKGNGYDMGAFEFEDQPSE